MEIIKLASDYQVGAHENIMKRLCETNMLNTSGYGKDEFCESAREKIRKACDAPDAAVHFLVGGTQTNATVIDALLKSYQGVVSADTGHVGGHEAGAIEFGGHKVLTIPNKDGKITADDLDKYCGNFYNDGNHEHMVMPGMTYISQPTENGTLYSLNEITAISEVCKKYSMPLYVDGARLAYALACEENDVTLKDLARLCDAFYIGGTKCGALFGEAVVIPNKNTIPHFFTIIKQHGALLAKGRLLGIQFDTLFTDDLYLNIGKPAIKAANRLRDYFTKSGYKLTYENPTNQVFVVLENSVMEKIAEVAEFSFWEAYDDNHTIVRFASSFATTDEEIETFIGLIENCK